MGEGGFEERDDRAADVAGTPEGDGDFETDNLPSTGETSAGGQVSIRDDMRGDTAGRAKSEGELGRVIDELSAGKIQP